MRFTMFILFAVCLQVSAASFGQKVTISGHDMPLEKVFSMIKKQTGYVSFYDYTLLRGKTVTLDLKDADIRSALEKTLSNFSLAFSIDGRQITIIEKKNGVLPQPLTSTDKIIKVFGIVYSEAGQPLSGANVTIKSSGKGTITNAKGEFELSAVPENATLIVSYIGYEKQEVKVTEGRTAQIYLNVTKNELDKVVVQAYGTTTQRLATGNIATVTSKEIERQPVMNPLQAIQGRVPGLIISQTSGYASAPFKVELRGRNLMNPNVTSDPLYIVDGVPLTILDMGNVGTNQVSPGVSQNGFNDPAGGQSPLFSINPQDIESVTVLKDGDATAIYGSRAANGVIIITTKKGKPGKTNFDINVYTGYSKVTRFYNLMNTNQYLQMRREAFYNDSIAYGVVPDEGNAPDLLVWDTTRYTDWQKFFWGNTGKTTDVQLSLSGGDKQSTFRIGADYHRMTSILTVSGADQRAALQFNFSHKSLDQKLNISFTNQYSYSQSDLIYNSGAVLLPPDAPAVFDQQGHLNFAGWYPAANYFGFANLLQPYTAKTGFLNSGLELKYELIKGLTVSSNLGYSTTKQSQMALYPITSQDPAYNPTGSSSFGNNNLTNWIVEPQIEYHGQVSKGQLRILTGASLQSVSQNGNVVSGNGYLNDNLIKSIANAPIKTASDVSGQYKYAAIFARLNYTWDNKYIINLSARRDGSSRFGPGRQFGNFGAIGAAWIFTEMNWMKQNVSFLSFGKLRASYGLTGSDNLGDYTFLTRWTSAGPTYMNTPTYVPTQHANDKLQWQVNKKLEAALDLGFWQDRVNVEVAWYQNRCGNQLVIYPLSSITGFTSVSANRPALVQNRGLESTIRARVIDVKDVSLVFNFNIGTNRNKLISYPNLLQSPYAYAFFVGQPLNISRKLHYTGVDPQTGLYSFQDKNKDGQIITRGGPNDDLYNVDRTIRYEGGFGSDFTFHGLQLSFYFMFRKSTGNSALYAGSIPGDITNQSTGVLNHWRKPGDNAAFARFSVYGDQSDQNFVSYSDGILSDASFIRLQNLSLSYNLPAGWVKKAKISGCKLFVRGENLLLITHYNGLDPETQNFGSMPPSKTITGGLQFNF